VMLGGRVDWFLKVMVVENGENAKNDKHVKNDENVKK